MTPHVCDFSGPRIACAVCGTFNPDKHQIDLAVERWKERNPGWQARAIASEVKVRAKTGAE